MRESSLLLSAVVAAALAAPPVRAGDDLAKGIAVKGSGLAGDLAGVTSGRGKLEGEPGSPARAVVLKGPESTLVVDLGGTREIKALVLQADADDVYMIERSLDGASWFGLLKIEEGLKGAGLRTSHAVLGSPLPARFLAVHAEGGDGRYFVSRLSVFSDLPTPWPPQLLFPTPTPAPTAASPAPLVIPNALPAPVPPRVPERFTETKMVAVKGMLAAAAAALLWWGVSLRRRGRPEAHRRLRDALLALLGVVSLAAWWNLGFFHFGTYAHLWDTFHYYIGAKYSPELRYTGLYECALAADVVGGRIPPQGRVLARNLGTNHLELLDADAAMRDCSARFGPERFHDFLSDVTWFRMRTPGSKWQEILSDHGYNGTPAWAILGRLLASTGPTTSDQIGILVVLDSVLLLVMWGAVAWAFGWRAACAGLVFWGTNYAARYWWNGGSFLRMDWLFCLVVGLCFLRRGRPRVAGALLALATLLRIFPGAVFLGLAAVAAARWVKERRFRITPEEKGLAIGAALAAAVVLPLSIASASGEGGTRWRVWQEFAANSRKHLATPLTNDVGLRTLLTWRPSTRSPRLIGGDVDPFARWKAAHVATAARMAPLLAFIAIAALAGFGALFRERPAWFVATAAVGFVPLLTELTCYYYSALAAVALLFLLREEVGAIWASLACATCIIPAFLFWDEDRYTLMSALVLAAVVATWLLVWRAPSETEAVSR